MTSKRIFCVSNKKNDCHGFVHVNYTMATHLVVLTRSYTQSYFSRQILIIHGTLTYYIHCLVFIFSRATNCRYKLFWHYNIK